MIKDLKAFCKSDRFVHGLKNFVVVCAYVIIIVALVSSFAFAEASSSSKKPDLQEATETWLTKIQNYMFKISTGAVVIAVGTGVFIKKFSMGKQDKIETGNKLIRDSIIGFVVLNAMPIIARTIQSMTTEEGGLQEVSTSSKASGGAIIIDLINFVRNLF